MRITPIKTRKITPGTVDIYAVLDEALPEIHDGDIVVITSKIVSICEGNVIPYGDIDKEQLVIDESSLYLPHTISKHGHHFTITNNTLISMAGIDESNGSGHYILWPRDSQKSANEIRQYLADKYKLQNIGVVITDSTCRPSRRGTTGISLAHSGFAALRNYIGKPDLFDKPFGVTQADVAGGLAAAAVVAMGEGAEQTPLCILSDMSFVEFQPRNPTADELAEISMTIEDDLFAPFLMNAGWQKGQKP